jgi:oligopeptide transport system ATP-binding protein
MENRPVSYQVRDLEKSFMAKKHSVKALDKVSFDIYEGETLGIVGESGCGKSTLGKVMLGILAPDSGQVLFEGKDVHKMKRKEEFRFCKEAQMIFQDPYASLDPTKQVKAIIGEGLRIHYRNLRPAEREERVLELINQVGLRPEHAERYPHEFSGGERQRIGIARALAVEPRFLLCDEPVSALDVSVQAQVINLLAELKASQKLTMLFISHDLSMVKFIADRIGVMYLGNLVEVCSSEELYHNHLHPYSQLLISSIPIPDPIEAQKRDVEGIKGEVSHSQNPKTSSCPFYHRCREKSERCGEKKPELQEVAPGHWVACHKFALEGAH